MNTTRVLYGLGALLLLVSVSGLSSVGQCAPQPSVSVNKWTISQKPELMQEVRKIQEQHLQRLQKVETQMRSRLGSSQNIKLGSKTALNTKNLEKEIKLLQAQITDLNRKQEFLDKLAHAFENKWYGQDLQEFMTVQLLEIGSNDLKSSQTTSKESLATFAAYLSIAVRELHEPQESLFAFVNSYIEVSEVAMPLPPELFLKTRNYTNGIKNEQAHGVPKDQLGEALEKKFKNLSLKGSSQMKVSQVPTRSADK